MKPKVLLRNVIIFFIALMITSGCNNGDGGIDYLPSGPKLFISNYVGASATDYIDLVHIPTGEHVQTIIPSDYFMGAELLYSAINKKVYVCSQVGNSIYVIDALTGTAVDPLRTFRLGASIWAASLDENANKLYGVDINDIHIFDLASGSEICDIQIGTHLADIEADPARGKAYILDAEEGLHIFDLVDLQVIITKPFTPALSPFALAFTAEKVYALTQTTVEVFDPLMSWNNTDSIPVGSGIVGIAIHQNRGKAYVSDWSNDTVSVIDLASGIVTTTIPVGSRPTDIYIDEGNDRAYVADSDSFGRLSVIDTAADVVVDGFEHWCSGPFSIVLVPE